MSSVDVVIAVLIERRSLDRIYILKSQICMYLIE